MNKSNGCGEVDCEYPENFSDCSCNNLKSSTSPGCSIAKEIKQAMKDLVKYADDTVWAGPSETMFDRLADLYIKAGGTHEELKAEWPMNF